MNDELKNMLNENYLQPVNMIDFLDVLLKQYESRWSELNDMNKRMRQSLSDLEGEVQILNLETNKGIKDYICKQNSDKKIDDLFDDLLDKDANEAMDEYEKLIFNIDHVKHVGDIVVLLRDMISKNELRLLETKDMIDFLKNKNKLKSEVEWINVLELPEFMGKTFEERVKKYVAYKSAGIEIEKVR